MFSRIYTRFFGTGTLVFIAWFATLPWFLSCSKAGHYETLASLEQFHEAFNADEGSIRIVLLLSPT